MRNRTDNHLGKYGWRWQHFGGKLMLVTDGGGATVVLSGDAKGLLTCSAEGRLERFNSEHPLAIALTALPELVELVRDIAARDDRPHYLPRLRAILDRLGLDPAGETTGPERGVPADQEG